MLARDKWDSTDPSKPEGAETDLPYLPTPEEFLAWDIATYREGIEEPENMSETSG